MTVPSASEFSLLSGPAGVDRGTQVVVTVKSIASIHAPRQAATHVAGSPALAASKGSPEAAHSRGKWLLVERWRYVASAAVQALSAPT